VKITPAWRVYLLGATLCVALTICSRNFSDRGGPYYMASLTLAGIAYLLAIREFFATPRFSRQVVVIGLILATVWHIELLRVPSEVSIDMFGMAACRGSATTPILSFPAILPPRGCIFRKPQLEQPESTEPISSRSAAFFPRSNCHSGVHLCTESSICGLRVRIVFVLLDLLRCTRHGAHLVPAFAWNPLLAIKVAGSGHIDIVGALLLGVPAAALVRRWRATAAVGLGLAIAVKLLPIVLLPLYWKRFAFATLRWRQPWSDSCTCHFLITAAFRSAPWYTERCLRGVFSPSIIHFTGAKEPIKLALAS
jgi:alpha-1,6-mannosyltransferase